MIVAHTIQLALTPVFVLVAVGHILNILSTRLGRIVDRARVLQPLHAATSGPEHAAVVNEIRALDRRISLTTSAIRLMVLSGLAIGTTVTVLFVQEMFAYPLEHVAAMVFFLAVLLLMWGLVLLLRETQVAAAMLRVAPELLRPREPGEDA